MSQAFDGGRTNGGGSSGSSVDPYDQQAQEQLPSQPLSFNNNTVLNQLNDPTTLNPEMANPQYSHLSAQVSDRPRIASLRIAPLDLGFLPSASASQTSLLEAVVGSNQPPLAHHAQPTSSLARPSPSSYPQPASKTYHQPTQAAHVVSGEHDGRGGIEQQRELSDESGGSGSFGASTEREWDVLSDASLRLNTGEADEEAVQELEKKVNKRRSNLPHLESQLAALEAQIKAAEERLARVEASRVEKASRQTA